MTGAELNGLTGPVIEYDEASAPFFDGARRGELMIRWCAACARWLGPQVTSCTDCGGAELSWVPVSGSARLVTWAVVHSPPHPDLVGQTPYVSGYVELAEGPWLPARIILEAAPVGDIDLTVGLDLTVAFVHPAEGESYPVFRPTC